MQVKLLLFTFYLNCELHAVSIGKPCKWMSNFWTVRFPYWLHEISTTGHSDQPKTYFSCLHKQTVLHKWKQSRYLTNRPVCCCDCTSLPPLPVVCSICSRISRIFASKRPYSTQQHFTRCTPTCPDWQFEASRSHCHTNSTALDTYIYTVVQKKRANFGGL